MKRTLPSILTPFLLLTILFISGAGFAQTASSINHESEDFDDAAPVARVARLSFVEGDVSFLRAGVTEWAPAVENLPLLAGDQVYAGPGARAEVQLGRGNYIRLSESTELTITELSASSAQFEITEGTAIIRIERLATAFHRFEVDTPNTAIVVQKDGLYRVEVRGEKNSELIVRRGEAEVSTEEGSFRVREGRRVLIDTATGGRLELAVDTTTDDWDKWSHERDTTIARTSADLAPDYVADYETTYHDFYGASDLSSYGTWTNYSSYGQCWIPRVGADWAPYRSGQWLWIPAAGWTWLSNEPWGWAPYHYGRWSYLSGLGWAWIPGFGSPNRGYGHRDYHWRPALVFFFNSPTPRGNYVGWYPLAPGERWRRHDNRRGDDRAHLPYPSPRDGSRRPDDGRLGIRPPQPRHGVTILPVEGFTRGDRSGVRPVAPGRELSGWINKGARAGLPEMKAPPVAAAPALGDNDRRSSRRIAVPPNEIIRRPVVTRNPNADSSARLGAPRERRLISPRNPGAITQGPALRERGSERGSERRPRTSAPSADSQTGADSGGERHSPKIRVPLPAPADKVDGDDPAQRRRRAREGDPAAERPAQKSEGGADGTGGERRHRRPDPSATPAPRESNPTGDRQSDNEARPRERRHPNSDPKPNEESRQRTRSEEPARPRDHGASSPRAEPRQERQERHQEKEQRQQERQQQQEQRKKP
ncbi:MAG: DUF6600 domain-containing protein [Acidobacteriota bacterium]